MEFNLQVNEENNNNTEVFLLFTFISISSRAKLLSPTVAKENKNQYLADNAFMCYRSYYAGIGDHV